MYVVCGWVASYLWLFLIFCLVQLFIIVGFLDCFDRFWVLVFFGRSSNFWLFAFLGIFIFFGVVVGNLVRSCGVLLFVFCLFCGVYIELVLL